MSRQPLGGRLRPTAAACAFFFESNGTELIYPRNQHLTLSLPFFSVSSLAFFLVLCPRNKVLRVQSHGPVFLSLSDCGSLHHQAVESALERVHLYLTRDHSEAVITAPLTHRDSTATL
jgi:hypothetical protein